MARSGAGEPTKVAIVTRSLAMGGAQRHIVKLCQSLRSQADLRLVLLCPAESRQLQALIPESIPILTSPFSHRDPRTSTWLAQTLRQERVSVIHSFLWLADAHAAIAALMLGRSVAVIASERGERGSTSIYRWFMRRFDRSVTFRVGLRFCANSAFGESVLIRCGAPPRQVMSIPNGIDTREIDSIPAVDLRERLGWPAHSVIVGCLARLEPYKGVDTLVRAVADMKSVGDARCVVVGDGPERSSLERLALELGLGGRIAFVGSHIPAEGFVKGFDIAVLPSRADTEHCSNAILEAMACSRPVVATRVAGNPELVVDGQTGLLVGRDDVGQLRVSLDLLTDDADLRSRLGAAGRARIVEHFSIDSIAQRFFNLWEQAAGKTKVGRVAAQEAEAGGANRPGAKCRRC